ncbi:Protein of unknown function [Lactobacillus helveticus CIRM-BIA 104]|uniref:Uncharacterized protein n=1 Tax=Lactobacillus helveticus CIRM-BIA 104 TaxID=1226333 RepID=U6FBB6_LACHE|nr:Protein of unknown function [Lactobacillus helveticus CIRM-BIA 104]
MAQLTMKKALLKTE